MHIRRLASTVLLAASATLLVAGVPTMHLRLVKVEPAAASTVTVAPEEIRLFFSQEPEVRATKITIVDDSRNEIAVAAAKADAQDGKIVIVPITGVLVSGTYTVSWRTMAKDGHAVNGTFNFALRASHYQPADPAGVERVSVRFPR